MQYLTLESHFWVVDHAIRPDTRNICSKELVSLIYRVASIIAPEEKIEVLILPSEIWCYKDIFKITGTKISIVLAVIGAVYASLTYHRDSDKIKLEMIKGCMETMQVASGMSGEIQVDDGILSALCDDYGIKKIKNTRYKTLQGDETIEYEETIIKTPDRQNVFQSRLQRQDFQRMIVPLPEGEEYEKEDIKWTIELISLVVKQKKEGKGIPWKWTYFWDDIVYQGIKILENNEDIDFLMQDNEFKQRIKNQEIQFSSWDNISVSFKMNVEISAGVTKNRKIYVSKVFWFNNQEIPHIDKKEKEKESNRQQSLFDIV